MSVATNLKYESQHLLADNLSLAPEVYQAAEKLCSSMAKVISHRESYVVKHSLDPNFCMPDGVWTQEAQAIFYEEYRRISQGRPESLDRLRFYTAGFTGFDLFTFKPIHGLGRPLPPDESYLDDFDLEFIKYHSKPDSWVEFWLDLVSHVPVKYIFEPPPHFGEVGWNMGGYIVNYCTLAYQERLNLMHSFGLLDHYQKLDRPVRVLEIGGGYGALALALGRIFPKTHYVVCDFPQALTFSGLYLNSAQQDAKVYLPEEQGLLFSKRDINESVYMLLPNFMFHRLTDEVAQFDLVINTLSLPEMSPLQQEVYAQGVAKLIGSTGVFFEQNMAPMHTLLSRHFCHRTTLREHRYPLYFGTPSVWSNPDTKVSNLLAKLNNRLRQTPAYGGMLTENCEIHGGVVIFSDLGINWLLRRSYGVWTLEGITHLEYNESSWARMTCSSDNIMALEEKQISPQELIDRGSIKFGGPVWNFDPLFLCLGWGRVHGSEGRRLHDYYIIAKDNGISG